MDLDDLERSLDRELTELPLPRAPETLLPRVMAAAKLSRQPWYRRPWITWPAAAQAASIALLLIIVGDLVFVFPWIQSTLAARVSAPAGLVTFGQRVREAATLMNFVLEAIVQPVAAYLFALGIALSVACGALWSALNRVALGGAHQ